MLSAKFWKPDATVRLLLSVIICVFGGSVLSNLAYYAGNSRLNLRFLLLEVAALAFLAAALVLVRRSWTLENIMRRMVAAMACFYIAVLLVMLGMWAQKSLGPPPPEQTSFGQMMIATLSIQGAGLVFMWLFVREQGLSANEAFGFSRQYGRAVLFGILTACIFLPIARLLQELSFHLMTRLEHIPVKPEQEVVQTLRHASVWAERAAMGAATIILAPVAEEMFFRGIMYPAIKQAGFPRLALWGTAALFALIHLTPVIFLPLFVLALLLVWLYEKTGNLLAPIIAHSLFNGLNFAMVYLLEKRVA